MANPTVQPVAPADEEPDSRARSALPGLLAGISLILVITMPKCIYVGDAVAMRAGTINLLCEGHFSVPAEYAIRFGEPGQYFYKNHKTGRWYSKYGILNSCLYVPPLMMERAITGELPYFEQLDAKGRMWRCLTLNGYNILISLLLASYLYRLASLYVHARWHAAVFVLIVFFGTFLWNYLRAHTVEIFQVLFFTALYYHAVRCFRLRRSRAADRHAHRHLRLALVFLGLLCLGKLIYVLAVPLVVAFVLLADYDGSKSGGATASTFLREVIWARKRAICASILLPLSIVGAIVGTANWYCFGSCLATGYEQWAADGHFFTSNIWEPLSGFLIDSRKSIFLYFPLMCFALPAALLFCRKYTAEFCLAVATFSIFYGAYSAFGDWRGGWCFGPRYLLFVLPVLSLPALTLFEGRMVNKLSAVIMGTAIVVVSAWFVSNQLYVHAFEFFVPIRVERPFRNVEDDRVREYFQQPFWVINRDLLSWNSGAGEFPPLALVRDRLDGEQYLAKEEYVRGLAVDNMFWLGMRSKKTASKKH